MMEISRGAERKTKRQSGDKGPDGPKKAFRKAELREVPRKGDDGEDESSSYRSEDNEDEDEEAEKRDERKALRNIRDKGQRAARRHRREEGERRDRSRDRNKRKDKTKGKKKKAQRQGSRTLRGCTFGRLGRKRRWERRYLRGTVRFFWRVVFSEGPLLEVSPPPVGEIREEVPREVSGLAAEAHGKRDRVRGGGRDETSTAKGTACRRWLTCTSWPS